MLGRRVSSGSRSLKTGPPQQFQLYQALRRLDPNTTRPSIDAPMAIRTMGQMLRSRSEPTPIAISNNPQKNIVTPLYLCCATLILIVSHGCNAVKSPDAEKWSAHGKVAVGRGNEVNPKRHDGRSRLCILPSVVERIR